MAGFSWFQLVSAWFQGFQAVPRFSNYGMK